MNSSKARALRGWLLALVLAVIIALGWRSCSQRVPPVPGPEAKSSPEPKALPPPPVIMPPVASVSPSPPPPGSVASIAAGESGMLSLSFTFDSAGLLALQTREEVSAATVRPLRNFEGRPGLYHRILGPTGEVLFENLEPDPRIVHWDTTDDGKTLRGGVATLPDMPLVLRLPAGLRGRLEVFLNSQGKWTRSRVREQSKLVGTFDLK